MKFTLAICALVLLVASAGASDSKTSNVYIGGGVSIPTDAAGVGWKAGFHGRASVGIPVISFIQLVPSLEYHSFPKAGMGYSTSGSALTVLMLGLNGRIYFTPNHQKTAPYLTGGLGAGFVKVGREANTYFDGGAGIDIYFDRSTSVFIEARYVTVSHPGWDVTYGPVSIGLKF